jgi:gliding motility-associated-like protein
LVLYYLKKCSQICDFYSIYRTLFPNFVALAFFVKKLRKITLVLLVLSVVQNLQGQLIVDTNYTPQYLVHNVLLSNNIAVSNISYTGVNRAIGYFDGTHSNIGLKDGILMTTGSVEIAAGPFDSLNTGVYNHQPGDSALTAICGYTTYDACILQFDFVPYSDTVSFDFAFGSQEYLQYTCCKVNDVFGFFISGPGIAGTKNIALIPGTSTPISINTLNGGSCRCPPSVVPGCCGSNSNYYINNVTGKTVGYAGFTKIMKAVSPVNCGQPYHIKIAIADAHDSLWDSGVFLSGHSFRGGTNPLNISALPSDSICPNDKVSISFPDNNSNHVPTWTFPNDANIISGSGFGPYVLSWGSSGTRQISLLDTGACEYDHDSIIVNVAPCDVQVPNIFTPGSGDNNDVFRIINIDKYPYSNLQVYNRWGQQVYYSQNYNNDWNGGRECDGTYFYILTLENHEVKKGFVTIIRK